MQDLDRRCQCPLGLRLLAMDDADADLSHEAALAVIGQPVECSRIERPAEGRQVGRFAGRRRAL